MGSPFPDPSPDDRNHMWRMARRIAYRWGHRCGDVEALTEDLEMAGWVGFYSHDHHKWWRAYQEMVDTWCRWRFGVTSRSRKEQRHRTAQLVPLAEWDAAEAQEEHIHAREILAKLCHKIQTQGRYRRLGPTLRCLALADGSTLSPAERKACGVASRRTYANQKKTLRRICTDLRREAAA